MPYDATSLESTYVRAFNAAVNIVASQNTDDDSVKDVAATVEELAVALWKKQNKFVKANDLREAPQPASPKPSGGSSRSDSGRGGLSPKQKSALRKALDSLGDAAPYTIDQIEDMDASGGQDSERSTAIGETFDAAWGGK